MFVFRYFYHTIGGILPSFFIASGPSSFECQLYYFSVCSSIFLLVSFPPPRDFPLLTSCDLSPSFRQMFPLVCFSRVTFPLLFTWFFFLLNFSFFVSLVFSIPLDPFFLFWLCPFSVAVIFFFFSFLAVFITNSWRSSTLWPFFSQRCLCF